MNKLLVGILSVFSFFSVIPAFASIDTHQHNCVFLNGKKYIKVYVNPDHVSISKEEIAIQIDDEFITASSIYSDGEGVFFLASSDHAWHCSSCDFEENLDLIGCCSNCGNHR